VPGAASQLSRGFATGAALSVELQPTAPCTQLPLMERQRDRDCMDSPSTSGGSRERELIDGPAAAEPGVDAHGGTGEATQPRSTVSFQEERPVLTTAAALENGGSPARLLCGCCCCCCWDRRPRTDQAAGSQPGGSGVLSRLSDGWDSIVSRMSSDARPAELDSSLMPAAMAAGVYDTGDGVGLEESRSPPPQQLQFAGIPRNEPLSKESVEAWPHPNPHREHAPHSPMLPARSKMLVDSAPPKVMTKPKKKQLDK
jgi:hypothetical protein